MFLAIETTTDFFSVSLGDGKNIPETIKIHGRQHSERLIPSIEQLFENQNLYPKDLKAIAAGRGPGSFTGIRVGLTCAVTYAQVLDIPLYALSSMDIAGKEIPAPAIRAFRNKFYTADYSPQGDRVSEYIIVDEKEMEAKNCFEIEAESKKLYWEAHRLYNERAEGDWRNIQPIYVMNTVYKKKNM
ncbi:MAG: tRNA (adenosine(37)-N6)-threonylcarbamoyltransferase complex dimerization subunit type 1 TsaB [Elusimicrobia bacterium]|nr:tRNA (adenosine(37)-N6)-threonylcarbamoyltransferase complex dimerization subunit type 1 TsaB [Elusimicrobiota bacterium]